MTRQTRYFLVGSVLLTSVCLCAGVVAYYSGDLPLGASNAGPEELSYLPADTVAVGSANVNEIMNSEFRQRLRQVLPTGQEKDRLQAELGLDIEHDIDRVVAGVAGATPSLSGALVLVRGRLNATQIEAMAVQHGAKSEEYKGIHLVVADPVSAAKVAQATGASASEPFTGAVAFLEPGLIGLGDEASLERGIDAHLSHQDATQNADLMRLVADAAAGGNAWAVGRCDALPSIKSLPADVQTIEDRLAVKWLSVSARVDHGLSGTVRAEARDQEAADQLRSVANGALAAGELMSGQNSRLDTMLRSLQVTSNGTTVSLAFTVPVEMLDMVNGGAALSKLMQDHGKGDESPAPGAPKGIHK